MTVLLMPRATAVWLIENTGLTFVQIAKFCDLHLLEVQAIADGEAMIGLVGLDPIASGQLTLDEIKRCEDSPNNDLILKAPITADTVLPKKKYTPLSKRQDRPNAIAWILKYYPDVSETDICRLLGTTKLTVRSVKDKKHKNAANIKPQNPVVLGLCSQDELEKVIGS